MINVKIVVFVVLCARNVTPQVYGLMASAKVAERTRKTKSIETEIGNSIFNIIQHSTSFSSCLFSALNLIPSRVDQLILKESIFLSITIFGQVPKVPSPRVERPARKLNVWPSTLQVFLWTCYNFAGTQQAKQYKQNKYNKRAVQIFLSFVGSAASGG